MWAITACAVLLLFVVCCSKEPMHEVDPTPNTISQKGVKAAGPRDPATGQPTGPVKVRPRP